MPTPEAIAVREGRIVEVGTLETMQVGAVASRVELLERIERLNRELEPEQPLFTWGHHPIWHGDIDREQLNAISTTRPIVVWHRGYHSFIVNDACYRWMGIDMDAAHRHPQVDVERGAFFETGLAFGYRYLNDFILGSERFRAGLDRMRQVIHHGGQTTIGDAAFGMYGFDSEWEHLQAVMERPDTPSRMQLLRFAMAPEGDERSDQEMVERFLSYPSATPTGCDSATTSRCSPTAGSSPSCCSWTSQATSKAGTASG